MGRQTPLLSVQCRPRHTCRELGTLLDARGFYAQHDDLVPASEDVLCLVAQAHL